MDILILFAKWQKFAAQNIPPDRKGIGLLIYFTYPKRTLTIKKNTFQLVKLSKLRVSSKLTMTLL